MMYVVAKLFKQLHHLANGLVEEGSAARGGLGLWPFVSDESSDFSRNSKFGTALRRGTTLLNYVTVTYVLIVAYVSPVPNALPNTGF